MLIGTLSNLFEDWIQGEFLHEDLNSYLKSAYGNYQPETTFFKKKFHLGFWGKGTQIVEIPAPNLRKG